jgi:hypothetical protein
MPLVEAQERIRERLRRGASLDRVEREVIAPAPFSEEQKAALWLFAFTTRRRLRREAGVP